MDAKELARHVGKLVTVKLYDDNPPRERSSETIHGHLLDVTPVPGDDDQIKLLVNDSRTGRDVQIILNDDRFSVEPGEKVVLTEAALNAVDRQILLADQQMREASTAVEALNFKITQARSALSPSPGTGRKAQKIVEQVSALEAERSLKIKKYKDLVTQHAKLKYWRNRIWTGMIKDARQQYQHACREELNQHLDRLQPIMASIDMLTGRAGSVTDGASVAHKVLKVKRSLEEAIVTIKAL